MNDRPADITVLLGLALGSVGLTLDDFDRLTPDEFADVYQAWERSHLREPWEQARFMACSCLQPWSKKSLKVTDVCRFAWDNEHLNADTPAAPSTRERFEELVRLTEKGVRR